MMEKMNFIIYSPSYDDSVGGSIVLHRLCDLINRAGGEACLCPIRPYFDIKSPISTVFDIFFHFLMNSWKSTFKVKLGFNTPVVTSCKKRNSIIVYPEIISGNPLKGRNVVRWLLHKPGFHTGLINFNSNDVIFYFQDAFNQEILNLKTGGELQVIYPRMDIYKRTNFGERRGTCYLLRKGKGRKIVHDLNDSRLIDDLSHEEVAKIFNKSERFISYDPYSLYSQYAAVCGCVSIVVPEENVEKNAWQSKEELRYGISYGFNEIEWAINTQQKAANYFESLDGNSIKSVRGFIKFCGDHFG